MPILGAHMSIAGGYYKAVDAAAAAGCDCVQMFTKNNNQWRAKPVTDEDIERFQAAIRNTGVTHPLSHASYLINLASPRKELWEQSADSMVVELDRADQLGIPFVVFHPGSFTTTDEATGLKAIIRALDQIHDRTDGIETIPLLEDTAGQGSNLGWKFEHLQTIIEGVRQPHRLGVCIDTCHAFAAGYPMGTTDSFESTVEEMETTFGLEKLKAVHLNDSMKPLGARKDRHAHIGHGEMGQEPFRLLLRDARFEKIPMYLETPKGTNDDGESWDEVNLKTLRALAQKTL